MLKTDSATIQQQLRILVERNLIKEMEPGKWVRKVLDQKTGLTTQLFTVECISFYSTCQQFLRKKIISKYIL